METNQASKLITITDYEDRPLRPLNELRSVGSREFRADVDFMVDVLCTEGSTLNQADYLFRLILLIKESLTGSLICKGENPWPGAAEEDALFSTFIHTDYGRECYENFVSSLMGEPPPDDKATLEATPEDKANAALFEASSQMYLMGANAIRRGDKVAISDLMQRSGNLISKLDAAKQTPGEPEASEQ